MAKIKGFTKVDNRLIRYASKLGLSPLDLQIIVTVEMHARENRHAFCRSETVANIAGVCERTVERVSSKLQERSLLKRPKGGRRPYWDFNPLFEKLNNINNTDIVVGVADNNTDIIDTQPRHTETPTPTNSTPNPDTRCHPKKTEEEKEEDNTKMGDTITNIVPPNFKEKDFDNASYREKRPIGDNGWYYPEEENNKRISFLREAKEVVKAGGNMAKVLDKHNGGISGHSEACDCLMCCPEIESK